jgi:predicted ATPase
MKSVAQIASCIGRDFDQALLLSIADIAPSELQEGLAALLQAGARRRAGRQGLPV